MRYGTKVVAIGILIVLVAVGGALAVGYERYNAEGTPDGQIKANATASPDVFTAVKQATFVEKVPAVLDDVAVFIKDFLAQFGLSDNRAR
jgi:hypothetical protein